MNDVLVQCVEPDAPVVNCCVCNTPVYTCERAVAINGDYTCPAHPNGSELPNGEWVCSAECYRRALAHGHGRSA